MSSTARQRRTVVRNDLYLRKLSAYLGLDRSEMLESDPFAIETQRNDAYVLRSDVEEQVTQPNSQFILGKDGSGKSALFKHLCEPTSQPVVQQAPAQPGQPSAAPHQDERRKLVVAISLTQPQLFAGMEEMMGGNESVLSFIPLTHAIYNTLWGELIINRNRYNREFRLFRSSHAWMTPFRKFYQAFPPTYPERPEDFELMTWLHSAAAPVSAPTRHLHPQRVLQELLHFMRPAIDRFYGKPPLRYSTVEVLVDGIERLSTLGVNKLLQDAETLCDYFGGELILKLFLELAPNHAKQVHSMHCVRRGVAQVIQLPPWTEEELQDLLAERLHIFRPGEYKGRPLKEILPDDAIVPSLRNNLDLLLAQGACKVYESQKDSAEDTPLHLLRIAHNIVAACAGCRPDDYPPPLNTNQVTALINEYWNMDKAMP